MSAADAFSVNYASARIRFRQGASARGFRLEEYDIGLKSPEGESLTIDVGILGSSEAEGVVIISSGLHGVEGFFGSAVQIALLEKHLVGWNPPPKRALLFLHALNPYGFAWGRRCNEYNIDLNRNFLLPGEEYSGSPEKYALFNSFFNPTSPPSRFEPFLIKAIALILRYGIATLKNTLPVGQYDFPKGLFFGGKRPSKTYEILDANLPRWLGNAKNVLHIDFHTGLGKKATYKLYTETSVDSQRYRYLVEKFGADKVKRIDSARDAYEIRGGLGKWCEAKFPQCNYIFLTAEFGTYPILTVIEALRAENRAYFWGKVDDSVCQWARKRLIEVFAPADKNWRESVVSQGVDLVQRAISACCL